MITVTIVQSLDILSKLMCNVEYFLSGYCGLDDLSAKLSSRNYSTFQIAIKMLTGHSLFLSAGAYRKCQS